MRKLLVSLSVASFVLAPTTAWADRDKGQGEREEEYGDNSCKYVCPSFDDSPVQDAFNLDPVICLPGSTCDFGGREDDEQPQ